MSRKKKPALEELRELIAQAQLTQHQAAAALGKSPRAIEYLLSGKQAVPRMAILAMRWIVEHGIEDA